jgi:UDP-glucose 4-epimerase
VITPGAPIRKAVVLGAGGFLGVNLARHLANDGIEVVCFGRTGSPHWPREARQVLGDFTVMPAKLLDELDDAVVFHLVSSSRPAPSTASAANEIVADVAATVRYLEATHSRRLRWIFLSSGGTVYGSQGDSLLREGFPTDPICSYGIAKLAAEKYFTLYHRLHGLDHVTVRLANPYGPWQDPRRGQGLVAALLYKSLRRDAVEIWGDGTKVRDYIYIQDAIEGVCRAATHGTAGETYNVGTGVGMSINQLVAVVEHATGIPLKIEYRDARSVDVQYNILDPGKLRTATGWQPRFEMERGLAEAVQWMKDAALV